MSSLPLAETLIIGGGPVGLWTAVLLKTLYGEGMEVDVVEKYREKTRDNPLKLHRDAFLEHIFAVYHGDERANAITAVVDQIFPPGLLETSIETSALETLLTEEALRKGVRIHYDVIVHHPLNFVRSFWGASGREGLPRRRFVIGADGAHSVVRQSSLFGDGRMRRSKEILSMVKVKYDTLFFTGKVAPLWDSYKTMKVMQCCAAEQVGMTRNALFLLVDHKIFSSLPRSCSLREVSHPDLFNAIKVWLNFKEKLVGEVHPLGGHDAAKVTPVSGTYYISEDVYRPDPDFPSTTSWWLVGDAAFGMPFQRGLNNGLQCASRLVGEYLHRPDFLSGPLYQKYVHDFAEGQAAAVAFRGTLLLWANVFVSVSDHVPWQVVQWPADVRERLLEGTRCEDKQN